MRPLFAWCCAMLWLPLFGCEESCSQEEPCNAKASSEDETRYRWTDSKKRYAAMIKHALEDHQDCPSGDCHCYDHVIEKDLRRFSNGIERTMVTQVHNSILYQVIDHKLYRSKDCMFGSRCSGVEHFLLSLIDDLPNTEFQLNVYDFPLVSKYNSNNPPLAVFSFSKTKDYFDIMYPAWSFWDGGPAISVYPTGIGRWDLMRPKVFNETHAWPWHLKKNKAFFRGSRTNKKRDLLVLLSRKKPDLIRADYTKNQAWKSDKDTLGQAAVNVVPFEYNCRYKYLFNFAGVAASFRLRHLFLCRSLVLHVGDEWQEFFYAGLKPWVHYVPVKDDISDAEELLMFFKENDELAREIAERGFKFIWNHLKMEDVHCYWKTLLERYTALLRFHVVKDENLVPVNH